jgi:hypothetical protein
LTGIEFAELAIAWWLRDLDATDEVDRLAREQPQQLPSLIQALAAGAPEGALSYIGVTILEDLSELAGRDERDDPSIDVLAAADLTPADTLEILSGPYPHYLDRWRVRERFATTFSASQFDALEDWAGRLHRRLVMDGDGVRLLDQSKWFQS